MDLPVRKNGQLHEHKHTMPQIHREQELT